LEFQASLQELSQDQAPATPSPSAIRTTDLAELETRLSRVIGPIAKRLVSDAVRRYRTISEIRQALAAQIDDPKERANFLKTDPGATVTVTMAARAPTPPLSFDPTTLDRLTQALTPHLGPISKVLVGRAARTARNVEELQNAVANEIPSADDRRRFLTTVRSAL
jgi:hypothetical protein